MRASVAKGGKKSACVDNDSRMQVGGSAAEVAMLEIAPDEASGTGAQRRAARERAASAPADGTAATAAKAAKADATTQRVRVLMSPFTNTTNPYIEMVKRIFVQIGYD